MHMKVNYILFTDGSVRRLRTGECISGYGIVVVDTTTKQYTCFGGDIDRIRRGVGDLSGTTLY